MHHDGSNSARARSARIRASHDYEATELDTIRRNAAQRDLQRHSSLVSRLSSLIGRVRGVGEDTVKALEPDAEPEILGGLNLNE